MGRTELDLMAAIFDDENELLGLGLGLPLGPWPHGDNRRDAIANKLGQNYVDLGCLDGSE